MKLIFLMAGSAFALDSFLRIDDEEFNVENKRKDFGEIPHIVSSVDFSQCEDDAGYFLLDKSNTIGTPNPIVKGDNMLIHMEGFLNGTISVDHVGVKVETAGQKLYSQNITVSQGFDPNTGL